MECKARIETLQNQDTSLILDVVEEILDPSLIRKELEKFINHKDPIAFINSLLSYMDSESDQDINENHINEVADGYLY